MDHNWSFANIPLTWNDIYMTKRSLSYNYKMVCRKFLVVSTILFDLGEIVVSKTNASDTTRGGRYLVVDIPEVPGSNHDDDLGGYRDNNRAMRYEEDRDRPSDNYNNFRDFHYSEYEDSRTESHEHSRMGPCEALIGELRTELSQNDATITLHGPDVDSSSIFSKQVF